MWVHPRPYIRACVRVCGCMCVRVCVCVCVYGSRCAAALCGTSSYTLPGIIDPLVYREHASPDTIARSRRCTRVRSLTPFSLSRNNMHTRARIIVRLCARWQNRFNGAMCEHNLFVIRVRLITRQIIFFVYIANKDFTENRCPVCE